MSNYSTTSLSEQQIMHAAEMLLQEVGDSFTIEQLSSRLQVSRATIYRRIGSKEALLERLALLHGLQIEQRTARERILAAVPQVIGRAGLVGATIELVAAEASVGVATVYRLFGDKDRLVRTFIEEWTPQTVLQELVLHPSADTTTHLTALAELVLPFFYQNRAVMRVVHFGTEDEQAYFNELRAGSTRMRDHLAAYFAAQIQAGRIVPVAEPQDLALAFIGMLFAFAVLGPYQYHTRIDDPRQTAHIIAQLFLGQLGTTKAGAHGTI